MLRINDNIMIADEYLKVSFVRSGGPGGQNVNKLNTKALLVFDLRHCPTLDPETKNRLGQLAGRRMTAHGTLMIHSDRFREQARNRQECLNRLRLLVQKALIRPKNRRPTRPTAASKRQRLAEKKHRSQVKSYRQKVPVDE